MREKKQDKNPYYLKVTQRNFDIIKTFKKRRKKNKIDIQILHCICSVIEMAKEKLD